MFEKHDKVVEKTRRHRFDNLLETFVLFGNYPRIARKRRILPKWHFLVNGPSKVTGRSMRSTSCPDLERNISKKITLAWFILCNSHFLHAICVLIDNWSPLVVVVVVYLAAYHVSSSREDSTFIYLTNRSDFCQLLLKRNDGDRSSRMSVLVTSWRHE